MCQSAMHVFEGESSLQDPTLGYVPYVQDAEDIRSYRVITLELRYISTQDTISLLGLQNSTGPSRSPPKLKNLDLGHL